MANNSLPESLSGLLERAETRLAAEFAGLPLLEAGADSVRIEAVLEETAARLGDNYPYFHPLYAGQMLKPPHPVARAAYALAMAINPNNHARDGGRASSEMEIEAVAAIAGMFGWGTRLDPFLGHLTSGGTMANLEALWVAGQVSPKKRIVGSAQAHYTHARISGVLKLDYSPIAADARGRMDLAALEDELRKGDVGTVVVTLGTTAIGAVDPLDEIVALRERYGFRIHVDAAYGGYFRLIPEVLDEPARRAFAAIEQADSIVVDPHKHGLQPYGCGCVLFRDPGVGRFYKHDSPYTYFTSNELHLHPNEQKSLVGGPVHLGEISLECSRAGAAAVALWATQRLLPLVPGGEFAAGLAAGRRAAVELDRRLRADPRFETPGFEALGGIGAGGVPELDIVVYKVRANSVQEASTQAQAIFDAAARRNLHLALVQLPRYWFETAGTANSASKPKSGPEMVTCLRSVLMKPEHEMWLDRIWSELDAAAGEILGE